MALPGYLHLWSKVEHAANVVEDAMRALLFPQDVMRNVKALKEHVVLCSHLEKIAEFTDIEAFLDADKEDRTSRSLLESIGQKARRCRRGRCWCRELVVVVHAVFASSSGAILADCK